MLRNPVISLSSSCGDYDEFMSEKEFCKELQCDVIYKNLDMLCKNLEADKFFPYFISKKCLDSDACDQIRAENTNSKRVDKMLNVLMRSCLIPLERLCKAINRQRTQEFISQRLIKDYDELALQPQNKKQLELIHMRALTPSSPISAYDPIIKRPPPPYTATPSIFPSGRLSPYHVPPSLGEISIEASNPIQDQVEAFNRVSEKQNLNRDRSPSPRPSFLTLDSRSWRFSRSPSEHDASLITRSQFSSFDTSSKITSSSSISSAEIYYPRQESERSWANTVSEDSKYSIRRPPTENLDISSSSSSDEDGSLQISDHSLSSNSRDLEEDK